MNQMVQVVFVSHSVHTPGLNVVILAETSKFKGV